MFLACRGRRCAVAVLAIIAMPALAPAGPPTPVAQLGSERFRQTSPVAGLAYSADGKRLATIDGSAINVWDASDGRLIHTTRIWNHELLAVAFEAASGDVLALAYFEHESRIYRIDSAAAKVPSRISVVTGKATGVFSPDGKYLAFREATGPLAQIVDTTAGKVVVSDWRNEDKFQSFAFRRDSQVAALSTQAGFVRVHDMKTGKAVHEFQVEGGTAAGMVFSPDEKEVVVELAATEWSHLACFDVTTGNMRWRYETHLARQPAFSADAKATLAQPDAVAAFATIGHLRANPMEAVAFLRQQMKMPTGPSRIGW
jgi:WD40 repeat protein